MKRSISSLYLFAVVLASAAALVAGCSNGQAAEGASSEEAARQGSRTRVETLVLSETDFEDVIELTGSVEAVNDATLSAQAAGTITALADLGESVRRGETVAQLDPREAQAAVAQAEAQVASAQAQYELAQDTYARQEPLYRDSIISAAEFQSVRAQRSQARAGLAQAEAALAQAQEQLSKTNIRTPFAGTVEEHFVEAGEQVNPGQQVVRVINTQHVKITAGVPERYANDIEPGTAVEVDFQALGEAPHSGRVTFVGRAVDPESRTFPIEISLSNPEGTFKPAMVAQLLVTREELAGALVIPRAAVIRDETGTKVYVVNRTDSVAVAEQRTVTLGPARASRTVVTAGLEAGDEVIVAGQNNLAPGDAVEVAEQHERLASATAPFQGSDQAPLGGETPPAEE